MQARGVPRATGARRVRHTGTVGSESAQGAAVAPALGPAVRIRPASCLHRQRSARGPAPAHVISEGAPLPRPPPRVPPPRRGRADEHAHSLSRPGDSRARARLSPPLQPRPNVASEHPAVPVTGTQGRGHEGSAQAQIQASALLPPPPLQGVPRRGEGLVARTPGSSRITNKQKAFTLIWIG